MNPATSIGKAFFQKVRDYQLLVKLRLSLLVVFSACMAYAMACSRIDWMEVAILALGGGLVTGAANALNQVLEKDFDKQMARTQSRPLAAGRMEISEAVLAAGLMSVLGIVALAYFNPLSAVLGALSLISYAFIYTPMKRVSPAAVWIGAVPGALPMAIGWVAATNHFSNEAWFLFSIQFFWQFPHFWAIAWVAYEDYARAGFFLLPTTQRDGRTAATALQCVAYAAVLIPLSFVPVWIGFAGWISVGVMLTLALFYLWYAVRLYLRCDRDAARKLMFSSFLYLPVVLIALLLDKF